MKSLEGTLETDRKERWWIGIEKKETLKNIYKKIMEVMEMEIIEKEKKL